MEKDVRNHYYRRAAGTGCRANNGVGKSGPPETLQWGNRKRMRCIKAAAHRRANDVSYPGTVKAAGSGAIATARLERRLLRGCAANRNRLSRNSECGLQLENNRPPEQAKANGRDPRAYSKEKKGNGQSGSSSKSEGVVWPTLSISLTSKEKEEDFMAFKGCHLPQRPKKRAKLIQRTLNLVCPGSWLCDVTLDRYEVREKKVSKKRPRGLKTMGNLESDLE